jgi:predicted MFS family arabinose efflux permease
MIMFATIMSRIVPASALITALPAPADRGAFMSVTASLQQLAGGIGSVLAGMIVSQQTPESPLEHFDTLGFVVSVCVVITLFGIYRVDRIVTGMGRSYSQGVTS